MASNSLLTISMITNETLDVLHNDCSFLRGVDRQYDSRFGNTGAQIGAQINIRKPARYFLARTQALQVQSTQEDYATLTLDKWYQTGMNFSVKEMSLDIDDVHIVDALLAGSGWHLHITPSAESTTEDVWQVGYLSLSKLAKGISSLEA